MTTWALLGVGLVVGFAVGYLLATSKSNRQQIEAEGKIRAAEGTLAELREQTADLRAKLDDWQQRFQSEAASRVTA